MAATGVPLIFRGEIPWVQAVYDRKDKKRGGESRWEEEAADDPVIRDNYASAKEHMEKVKLHVEEDVKKGWMVRSSVGSILVGASGRAHLPALPQNSRPRLHLLYAPVRRRWPCFQQWRQMPPEHPGAFHLPGVV